METIKTDTERRITEILKNDFLSGKETKPTDRFDEELGMSSLDVYEFAMMVEEAFGLEITDDEIEDLRTVEDVVKLVAEKREV